MTDTGIHTALIATGGSFQGSKASGADRSTSNFEITVVSDDFYLYCSCRPVWNDTEA